MSRLSRAETQARNRARVLAAARAEFAERGYRDAKIDLIAERAELTRGAVYSNFPGKRALYLAVLAEDVSRQPTFFRPGATAAEALGSFARAWVTRAADERSLVLADAELRPAFTQLLALNALLLGLALETHHPVRHPPARLVRLASTVLTTLHGASQLAGTAPGFVEPFDVISACEQLAELPLNDFWAPPQPMPEPLSANGSWSPPEATDLISGDPFRPADGVVAVLGLHRLAAAEQAIRGNAEATVVLVTSQPAEFGPLVRLVVGELGACLRQAFPRSDWPNLRVVFDESVAAAAGVLAVSDESEVAVRVADGRIVARAEGPGAVAAIARSLIVAETDGGTVPGKAG